MYVWLWRKIPGGILGKLLGCAVLLAGALALLFYVVFPYVEPRLPFNNVNVDLDSPTTPGPSAPSIPARTTAPAAPVPGSTPVPVRTLPGPA